jgi:hypothetical protein
VVVLAVARAFLEDPLDLLVVVAVQQAQLERALARHRLGHDRLVDVGVTHAQARLLDALGIDDVHGFLDEGLDVDARQLATRHRDIGLAQGPERRAGLLARHVQDRRLGRARLHVDHALERQLSLQGRHARQVVRALLDASVRTRGQGQGHRQGRERAEAVEIMAHGALLSGPRLDDPALGTAQ